MPGLKAKTIKSILRRKIDAWVATIDDEELQKVVRREAVVTGGCIASMLLGEDVNDFDVYFRTKDTVRRVADYYLEKFKARKAKQGGIDVPMFVEELEDVRGEERVRVVIKSAGVAKDDQGSDYQYFESAENDHDAGDYISEALGEEGIDVAEANADDMYQPTFISSNAISLRGKVQIILRFYGDPEKIHSNYDFVHCMNHWESGQSNLVLRQDAMEALLSKTLVYRGSLYPVCSVFRTRKFIERGWRINAGQFLKMSMQIAELDLTKFDVLEDQLTGVDVAYFQEVIEKVQAKDPTKVDAAYLTEIIDRMF